MAALEGPELGRPGDESCLHDLAPLSLNCFFLFSALSSHSLLQLNPHGVGSVSRSTPSSATSHTGPTGWPGQKPPSATVTVLAVATDHSPGARPDTYLPSRGAGPQASVMAERALWSPSQLGLGTQC